MVLQDTVWKKGEETMSEDILFKKGSRDGMHFHSRKRSQKGIAGFVLSLIGVTVFIALCVVSAMEKGEAGSGIGILGLLVAALSAGAFFLSLKGLKEQDVYTTIPFAGLVISGVLFVFLFCLYILGL